MVFHENTGFIDYSDMTILYIGKQETLIGTLHIGLAIIDCEMTLNELTDILKLQLLVDSSNENKLIINLNKITSFFNKVGNILINYDKYLIIESYGNKLKGTVDLDNYETLLNMLANSIDYHSISNFTIDMCISANLKSPFLLLANHSLFTKYNIKPNYNLFLSSSFQNANLHLTTCNFNKLFFIENSFCNKINIYTAIEKELKFITSKFPANYTKTNMKNLYGINLIAGGFNLFKKN